jgi:hypothetical protein
MEHGARSNRGFSLVEALGVLALVAVVSAGAVTMIHAALDDTRGQHAGRHQAQAVEASERYMRERYADLLSATTGGPVAVPLQALSSHLPVGFQPTNAYHQTPCLRVMQPMPGRLNALIITEGGESIPAKDLAYVSAHAGPGGGHVSVDDPAFAQGAFGSWRVDVAAYGSTPCGGTAGTAPLNRLASALFFDGPGTAATDFLYRGEVPGHPELNALDVPLAMRGRAVAVEHDASDPMCSAVDPMAQGRIAVSAEGMLLTCQSGTWRRQASAFWQDPVADFASLPLSGANRGDTRVTLDTQRAFTWNGASWRPLAVDSQGDMEVPRQLTLTNWVVRGAPCSPDGAISREQNGLTLSCQSGRWQTLSAFELDPSQSEIGSTVIMRSNHMPYPADTQFYSGPFYYDAPNDTVMASVERQVMPTRDGLIVANASVDMSVGTIDTPTDTANVNLIAQVVDRDTGNVLAVNQARQTKMVYDRAILAVTLSKALPRNVNGYTFQMLVRWSRRQNTYDSNFYHRSNYRDVFGNVVELTPIHLSWNFDLTY